MTLKEAFKVSYRLNDTDIETLWTIRQTIIEPYYKTLYNDQKKLLLKLKRLNNFRYKNDINHINRKIRNKINLLTSSIAENMIYGENPHLSLFSKLYEHEKSETIMTIFKRNDFFNIDYSNLKKEAEGFYELHWNDFFREDFLNLLSELLTYKRNHSLKKLGI